MGGLCEITLCKLEIKPQVEYSYSFLEVLKVVQVIEEGSAFKLVYGNTGLLERLMSACLRIVTWHLGVKQIMLLAVTNTLV